MAGVGSRLVLAAGDIADVMQRVLDARMRARQCEKTFRSHLISGQAGNGVDRLHGGCAADDAFAGVRRGHVPRRGVGAVGKWPAGATVGSQA